MGEKSQARIWKMLMKIAPSKALVIRLNLMVLAVFFIVYTALLLQPSSSSYFENAASVVRCSLRECHHKVERGLKMQELMDENQNNGGEMLNRRNLTKLDVPRFMERLTGGIMGTKIGMVNMEEWDTDEWKKLGQTNTIHFDRVSELFKWQDLFPEWIDEEEETDVPTCPEIPMPELSTIENLDIIVAKLPCDYPEEGWAREVWRLQVHLVVANLAAKRGKRDWDGKTKVAVWSKCRPMMEIFRCDDLVRREGEWWLYQPEGRRLEQKVELPIGSCKLALPLWGQGIDEVYDQAEIEAETRRPTKREAYATVIHSSESYVCGAITLAQSLIRSGTTRDLVLLLDYSSISLPKRRSLAAAGWILHPISRIRNPRAEAGTYNEYNYSKLRLWQLTRYHKVVFIDSDILVLRNLDLLFHFPQMSATGNDVWIFNSGIMVIEPSNCTFRALMNLRNDVVSYNGGDQGFLNEIFVWWHRLPRRVNFLKNFWSNSTTETALKNQMFLQDPPVVYSIHYLGWKPWMCYRDYDCNFDVEDQVVYGSDAAHERWWKVHDSMEEGLRKECGLTMRRRTELNWERRKARLRGSADPHWKINITDPRRRKSNLIG